MTQHSDNPSEPQPESHGGLSSEATNPVADDQPRADSQPSITLPGDPLAYVGAGNEQGYESGPSTVRLPDDLRISWSWAHLLVFLFAGLGSATILPLVVVLAIGSYAHKSQDQMQGIYMSSGFLIGAQLLLFAMVMFFLYITLAVLRDAPFWWSLGWRKLPAKIGARTLKPWMFFVSGSGVAIVVALASLRVKGADHTPMEELFKDPRTALALMAMAVFVAPLVEETVFRGYLYPFFAVQFAKLAGIFGMESARAVRFGVTIGVLLTGFLFGLMHGSQLGWNWGLVSLLTMVGVLFTFARARTGTVLASFLMHLGYNSLIAVSSILATKGFQHMPPPGP